MSKIKGVLVLKGIFSETRYVCVYLFSKFQFSITIPPPKKPTRIRLKLFQTKSNDKILWTLKKTQFLTHFGAFFPF